MGDGGSNPPLAHLFKGVVMNKKVAKEYNKAYNDAFTTLYARIVDLTKDTKKGYSVYIDEGGLLGSPRVILSKNKIAKPDFFTYLGKMPVNTLVTYLSMKVVSWIINGYPDYSTSMKIKIEE